MSVISLLGRKGVERRERRMENIPEVNIRWSVVILALFFITLTLTTLAKAQAAAVRRQRATPRKYVLLSFISSAEAGSPLLLVPVWLVGAGKMNGGWTTRMSPSTALSC